MGRAVAVPDSGNDNQHAGKQRNGDGRADSRIPVIECTFYIRVIHLVGFSSFICKAPVYFSIEEQRLRIQELHKREIAVSSVQNQTKNG